ncbi:L,D-transpeptidase family protein [Bradyrhizobium sp.]|uniref:L,D-transpeptidase family protein n=1 Tax=Bradyrhizobium sp. TaxID=376 RepID=UPI002D700846|nr:L,D-transpeptidase family protein [Bradyrhizobium sp.]HZR74632.1 L,D-transpeptidase family protein [Bradyrhizobium sp.]
MRGHAVILVSVLVWLINIQSAAAKLNILVDKATQRMLVIQDGYIRYMWPVSTGRDNMQTPNGVYSPQRLERNWFSSAYYDSPMPFSIFFHGGYAIHGSYAIDRLGGPASHGCVRLHPHHAAILFDLVQQEGPDRTTIEITDEGRPMEQAMPGREIAATRGPNPPMPRIVHYRENVDMPDLPPVTRGSQPIVMKGIAPPSLRPPATRRALSDANPPANVPRAGGGAGETDVAKSSPRLASEPADSRSQTKVIDAPKVVEAASSEPAQAARSASSIKLLPASCWSGGASRWQWWASNQANSCR